MLNPFTRAMLDRSGISKGMRVLDVGSGAGDVALLCAEAVGVAGEVTGVDRAPAAVETAGQRARTAGFLNVHFVAGDPVETAFEQPFDAVVGRLVLMHQPDPVSMLRKLSRLLRPGGIIAFQEYDISGAAHSFPECRTYEQGLAWIAAAFTKTGTDVRLGAKLYSAFVAAGLPMPELTLNAGVWGGADSQGATLLTDVVRTLLPVITGRGIASHQEVDIGTLSQRVQAELLASGGVIIAPSLISCWARLPLS